jgi:GT2 family glycosyltransferase
VRANTTVVIPAHNAECFIADQLSALAAQVDAGDFEVVVALNRCTDRTRDVAGSFERALNLRIVEANERPGAAYARNVAVSGAGGDLVLFCDADDEVGPSWAAEMAAALCHADLVGGHILLDDRGVPAWIPAFYDFALQTPGETSPHDGHDGRIPLFPTASMGCRLSAFVAVGGFDEAFSGAGAEDIDLIIRMVQAGYRLGFAPEATLRYRPRTSFRALLAQRRLWVRGDAQMAAKHGYALRPRHEALEALRTVRALVVKQGERRPQVLLARGLVRYHTARELRRVARNGAANVELPEPEPGANADFVVPFSCPVLGGLGLRATTRASARWYAREGVEQVSLALFFALAGESGRVVDYGADVGIFTVGVALRRRNRAGAGETRATEIVAFEPDFRARAALEINLVRHGVSSVVDVRTEAVVTLDEAVPGEVVALRIDAGGTEVAVLKGASALLACSPEVAVLVKVYPESLGRFGLTPDDLFERFPTEQWAGWLVQDASQGRPAEVAPLWTRGRDVVRSAGTSWYANALFVRRHREAQVAATLAEVVSRDGPP